MFFGNRCLLILKINYDIDNWGLEVYKIYKLTMTYFSARLNLDKITFILNQVQISGERWQGHWSSDL